MKKLVAALLCVILVLGLRIYDLTAAAQPVVGFEEFPVLPMGGSTTSPSFSSIATIDAAGESVATIMMASKACNAQKIVFRTATTTTATGFSLDGRIETVSATTGDPTGTLWAANTNVAIAVVDANDNVMITSGNLTANATLAKGDLFAIVLVAPASYNGQIARFDQSFSSLPYNDSFTGGAWAKNGNGPTMTVECSDGSYMPVYNTWPINTTVSTIYNTGSNPDEIALYFTLPYPRRVTGARVWYNGAAAADFRVVLYNTDGATALGTITLDGDLPTPSNRISTFYFSNTISLAKNTTYYLSVLPTTTTSITLYEFTAPSAAALDAFAGGQSFYRASRQNAATPWTLTATTQRPFVSLLFDAADDGTATGGGFFFIGSLLPTTPNWRGWLKHVRGAA